MGEGPASMVHKSRGQLAYETDVALCPLYYDGIQRPTWDQLDSVKQWLWGSWAENRDGLPVSSPAALAPSKETNMTLLPCPFKGCKPRTHLNDWVDPPEYSVQCGCALMSGFTSEPDAIAAWNTRTPPLNDGGQ